MRHYRYDRVYCAPYLSGGRLKETASELAWFSAFPVPPGPTTRTTSSPAHRRTLFIWFGTASLPLSRRLIAPRRARDPRDETGSTARPGSNPPRDPPAEFRRRRCQPRLAIIPIKCRPRAYAPRGDPEAPFHRARDRAESTGEKDCLIPEKVVDYSARASGT